MPRVATDCRQRHDASDIIADIDAAAATLMPMLTLRAIILALIRCDVYAAIRGC